MTQIGQISITGGKSLLWEGLGYALNAQGYQTSCIDLDVLLDAPPEQSASGCHIVIIRTVEGTDILDTCRTIRKSHPHFRICLIDDDIDADRLRQAMAAGVAGVLSEGTSCEQLVRSLESMAFGERVVPAKFFDAMSQLELAPDAKRWQASLDARSLSPRETETLRCLAEGHANKLISRRLDIAEATVKIHVKSILRKLPATNRTQAALWAIRNGMPTGI